MIEKCSFPDYSSCYLEHEVQHKNLPPCYLHHAVQQKPLPHGAPFPFSAGHFSLKPSPLKPDEAHITFVIVPSLLHTILPYGPLRMSPPPTNPLSALIPVFVLIRHRHQGGEGAHWSWRPWAKKAQPLFPDNCHVVTYSWMSCITTIRQRVHY